MSASPKSPQTPQKQQYTSLSSLLRTFKSDPSASGGASHPHPASNTTTTTSSSNGLGLETSNDANGPTGPAPQTSSGWLTSVTEEPERSTSRSRTRDVKKDKDKEKGKGRLSLWRMMALTVSMGGSQIAWTVELGYGTPYLLSLGLSEQLTSLVWLAGPISGLIAQPLIGAISDSSHSRYRRRYWIVTATMLLVLSGLGLAFTEPIARSLVDLFGGGQGDWDPRNVQLVRGTSIGIAVFCFYCLDFALNALQASLRNLVLDVTPGEQLAAANAWHGRFNHVGNIVGFTMGFLNLNHVPVIRLLGGGQFRKVCVVALLILVLTVWITCWTQEEDERESIFGERKSKIRDVIGTIYEAVLHLPKPVRRVCIVQIAAFMGWFPYLFYSTTYVAEVMAHELGHEPDIDKATRAGSLALLIYSFVAIIAGTLLPYLAARDRRLLKPDSEKDEDDDEEDEEDIELERIREMVRQWKAEAARQGRPLKLPTMPFMLRNIWTAGLVLFAMVMASTFFITKVWQATVAIALVGICWAIACWVPFAIIMEFLKEMDDSRANQPERSRRAPQGVPSDGPHAVAPGFRPIHARAASSPLAFRSEPGSPARPDERTPLTRSYSSADIENATDGLEYTGSGPVAGGTIMGIHNLAIVFPQFIIALVASVIFKLADGESEVRPTGAGAANKTGVAWVLRFGGLMALVGAAICRKVPPTKTEKVS
ncbi:major facilitator superfamily domain-containing protein [Naematelia encephala]|uniref:Major facilitator superfamily domain-containing protein n=1 Tax=Naematelia encephala TaxID=71784 RepID=A0A1Y2ARN1_9TREE|nr:major facilitator superfamily domain-containing protein [Naematelia encephala]